MIYGAEVHIGGSARDGASPAKRGYMSTEDLDPHFVELDTWTSQQAVSAMIEGQFAAIGAVQGATSAIAAAVDGATARLFEGRGRLIYAGAGTSGRVAVQDGVELLPTYGWPWERMAFAVAGGQAALMQAVENAEDDRDAARAFVVEQNIGADDVVIGVAASGKTPYTLALLEAARAAGALTIAIANNPDMPMLGAVAFPILLDTGSEPVCGSTRMKAGTAQKVALNMFSTALMVRLGGVYKGLMVGMQATNAKLRKRAAKIVMALTHCDDAAATRALEVCKGDIRAAVLLALGIDDSSERATMLAASHGNLRKALAPLLED
jgi:N-acetylmuramic acid 6-phosphate etherase